MAGASCNYLSRYYLKKVGFHCEELGWRGCTKFGREGDNRLCRSTFFRAEEAEHSLRWRYSLYQNSILHQNDSYHYASMTNPLIYFITYPHLSIYIKINQAMFRSIYFSMKRSIFIYTYIYIYIYIYGRRRVCAFVWVCVYVCLYVITHIYLSICLSITVISIYLSMSLFISIFTIYIHMFSGFFECLSSSIFQLSLSLSHTPPGIYIYIYIYIYVCVCGAFNKFPDFFCTFKFVVHSWKFNMLLLYILWDDRPIFMISDSNEQLQQELEYTLLKPDCHCMWISKMQSGRENSLEERYAIKLCFKLEKMPQKSMECFRLLFGHLAWIKHQFLSDIRDSRKAGSLWGMMRGMGGVRKSIHQSWLGNGLGLGLLCCGFKRLALFKLGQWHFQQDNAPVQNSILVTDYLTKMSIKTVPQPPYSPDLAPSDFWLFPKLRGCRYETNEEVKEAVTKVIDTLTQEDFHGGVPEVVGTVQKCIAAGGDYLEGD